MKSTFYQLKPQLPFNISSRAKSEMDGDDDYAVALKLQQQFDLEYERNLTNRFSSVPSLPSSSNAPHLHEIDDFNLALQLHELENGNNDVVFCGEVGGKSKTKGNLADNSWELLDPNPDVLSLFVEFNNKFFWGKLASVEVIWSTRMTLCAGVCEYEGRRSGFCCIKLSEPLLKLRPRKDLLETLLHEMIHAYLFLTDNNRDRDGHGPEFQKHMYRLNRETGLNITVYHSFHDEVALYQQHWWRCDGPCRSRGPYYGYVKRSMNRPPSARDTWWAQHQSTCGGKFTKIKEPEKNDSKNNKKNVEMKTDGQKSTSGKDISNMLKNHPNVLTKNPSSTISQTPKLNTNISSLSSNNSNKLADETDYLFKSASTDLCDKGSDTSKDISNTYFAGTGYKLGSSTPLSSASKVLRDLHEEMLANRGNIMKEGSDRYSNMKNDKGNNNDKLNNKGKSNSIKNSQLKILKSPTNQTVINNKNNTTIDNFFTSKSNSLNNSSKNSSSPFIPTNSKDVKSILSDASLRVGEVVRIPKFVSVSNHKHFNNKYERFFKTSNDHSNICNVSELKRKSEDDNDPRTKKFSKVNIREEVSVKNHSVKSRPVGEITNEYTKNTIEEDLIPGDVNKIMMSDNDDDDEMCVLASKCEEVYSQNKIDSYFASDIMKDENSFESPELTRNFSATSSPGQLFPTSPSLLTFLKSSSTKHQESSIKRSSPKLTPINSAPKKKLKAISAPCIKETLSLLVANKNTSLKKPSPVRRSSTTHSETCQMLANFPLHHSIPPHFNSFITAPLISNLKPFNYHNISPSRSTYSRYLVNSLPRYICRRCTPYNSQFYTFIYPGYISHVSLSYPSRSYRYKLPHGRLVGYPLIMPKSLKSGSRFGISDSCSLTSYPIFSSFPYFRSLSYAKKLTCRHKSFSGCHGSSSQRTLHLNLSLPILCPSPTPSQSSTSSQFSSSSSLLNQSYKSMTAREQEFQFSNSSPIKLATSTEQSLTLIQTLEPEIKSGNDSDSKDLLPTSISSLCSPNNISIMRVVSCPVCKIELKIDSINNHLDACLNL